MIRTGLIINPVVGFKSGINYWQVAPGPTDSIYTKDTVADVNTFFQTALSTSDDYTPYDGYNFDLNDAAVPGFFNGTGTYLQSMSGSSTVESPHGRAALQVSGGSTEYWYTHVNEYDMATDPFAFIARLKVTAKPAFDQPWLTHDNAASPHYSSYITTAGYLKVGAKQSGPETNVAGTVDISDSAWRWVMFGRSTAAEKLWCATPTEEVETAFASTVNLTPFTPKPLIFGTATSGGQGVVDCELDHLLIFKGTAAENVYTNYSDIFRVLD